MIMILLIFQKKKKKKLFGANRPFWAPKWRILITPDPLKEFF